MPTRIVCWFSCGAGSAVASKLAVDSFGDRVIVAYCDTGAEHPDNARFLRDCERWYGREICVLKSEKYRDVWDVFEKTRYLSGVKGARCTVEMKKAVREAFEELGDLQVFGFDSTEGARAERFRRNNPGVNVWFPLIEANRPKEDCFAILTDAGIDLPAMYKLGYRNNNCIGCVKGQAGYWNKIRRDFPATFERMAKLEREIGAAICKTEAGGERKRIFLDELDPNFGRYEENMSCGFLCEVPA